MPKDDKIEVETVNKPGYKSRVDRIKYVAMKEAILNVLPDDGPGMEIPELKKSLLNILDQDLWPGGDKVGWWIKCVHLDLEAKGILARADKPPVCLRKV